MSIPSKLLCHEDIGLESNASHLQPQHQLHETFDGGGVGREWRGILPGKGGGACPLPVNQLCWEKTPAPRSPVTN